MKRGIAPKNGPGKWFGVETIVLEPGGAKNEEKMLFNKDSAIIKVPKTDLFLEQCTSIYM